MQWFSHRANGQEVIDGSWVFAVWWFRIVFWGLVAVNGFYVAVAAMTGHLGTVPKVMVGSITIAVFAVLAAVFIGKKVVGKLR